jgi:integrase
MRRIDWIEPGIGKRAYPDRTYRWVIQWRDARRRQHEETLPVGTTIRSARVARAERVREARLLVPQDRVTLRAFVEKWDAAKMLAVEPSTMEAYRGHVKHHLLPALGDVPLREIDVGVVQDRLVSTWTGSPNTLRKVLVTLRGILNAAHLRRLAQPVDLRALELPKRTRVDVHAFTLAEVRRIAAVADDWYAPDILFLAVTGLRMGEYCALREDDVDLDAGTLHVRQVRVRSGDVRSYPKTNSAWRTVELSSLAVEQARLKRRLKLEYGIRSAAEAFPTPRGRMVNPSNWHGDVWKPAVERAGVPYDKPHALRHTFASLLIAAGCESGFVKDQMGHSTVVTTLTTYAKWWKERNPVQVARFERFLEEGR